MASIFRLRNGIRKLFTTCPDSKAAGLVKDLCKSGCLYEAELDKAPSKTSGKKAKKK